MKKFFQPKNFLILALCTLAILALSAPMARAAVPTSVEDVLLQVLGWWIQLAVSVLATILAVVISALVWIAQYNGFITAPPVMKGWGIVRDLCNMFFVLILLVIAFATILRIPNYSIKQLLKRVIIFAILINFSKMICGLLIDFAQVIMLTFVNGFKDIGGANMSVLIGLDKLLDFKIDQEMPGGRGFWEVVGAYMLAWIYVIIMLVVMVVLLVTLIFRIVMLWIYIILSPLAYLGAVAPLTRGVTTNWWRQFSQHLVTGPLLAFFIWLSLATLGQFNDSNTFLQENGFKVPDAATEPQGIGGTEVGTTAHMMRLGISLSLLIGGLLVAKSFGGVAGGAAAAGMARIQGGAGWVKRKSSALAKRGAQATGRAAWKGTKAAGRGGLQLARTVDVKGSRFAADKFGWKRPPGDKGYFTAGASAVRQGLMTKEGLRNNFNKATGNIFNKDLKRIRAAGTDSGHVFINNIKHDLQPDGSFKSKDGHVAPFKSFPPGGWAEALYKQGAAGGAYTAQEAARLAQYKKEQEDSVKPYKDKNKEELRSQFSAANHQQKQGIANQLAKNGGLTEAIMEEAKKIFADNPIKMKDFLDTAQIKQPDLVYDLSGGKGSDGWEAMSKAVGKKKIKIPELTLNAVDEKNPEDLKKVGHMADLFRDVLGEAGLNKQLEQLGDTGDPKVAKIMQASYANLAIAKKQEMDTALAEMRYQAKDPKEIDEQEAKFNNELMSLRGNSFILDPHGDIGKAFSDALGNFDEKMATQFMSRASNSQLAGINPDADSFKNPLTAQAFERAIANGMNYQKLLTLYKSGKNPDAVNFMAKAMAKFNHPDSEKIVYNITNDVDFKVDASRQNGVIQELMKQNFSALRTKGISSNDLAEAMEGFRQHGGSDLKDKSHYDTGKGGKLKPGKDLDKLFKAYFKI